MSPALGPRVGVVSTRKVVTWRADPPPGHTPDPQRAAAVAAAGEADRGDLPRFLVVENVGQAAGPVCIWGELGAYIRRVIELCRSPDFTPEALDDLLRGR